MLLAFLASAALVWLRSFGYVLLLPALRGRRPPDRHPAAETVRVTTVVPTLDEERWIDRMLEILRELN